MEFLTKQQVNLINEPIADDFIEQIDGFDYVGHPVLADKLNKIFNFAWSWKIIDHGIEEIKSYKKSFKNNKTYNKQPQENESANDIKSYYAWVLGELEIPVVSEGNVVYIRKQCFGGKQILGNAKVQSQVLKSAASDAFKKAASMMGIARNVYMNSSMYKKILEEESMADAWTEDLYESYSYQINLVKETKEKLGNDNFNKLVNEFCSETDEYTTFGKISPSNICQFLDWFQRRNTEVKYDT